VVVSEFLESQKIF